MGLFPVDPGCTLCHKHLLDIGTTDKQLSDGSAVPISCDALHSHFLIGDY